MTNEFIPDYDDTMMWYVFTWNHDEGQWVMRNVYAHDEATPALQSCIDHEAEGAWAKMKLI